MRARFCLLALFVAMLLKLLLAQPTSLPARWDWRRVGAAGAREWSRQIGRPLRPGRYCADVYDQHRHGYCGFCFAVAPLQAILDQLRIGQRISMATRLDLAHAAAQVAFSRREDGLLRATAGRGAESSVCFGGDPAEVIRLLQDRRMGLKFAASDGGSLTRAPDPSAQPPPPDTFVSLRAELVTRAPVDNLKWYVYSHGPIVAYVASSTLLDPSDPSRADVIDHVVTIVGWTRTHWIARNSWGTSGFTRARPQQPQRHVLQLTPLVPWKSDGRGCFHIPLGKELRLIKLSELRPC